MNDMNSTMSPFMPASPEDEVTPPQVPAPAAPRGMDLPPQLLQYLLSTPLGAYAVGQTPYEYASGVVQGGVGGAAQGVDSMLGLVGGGLPDSTMIDADQMAAQNPTAAMIGSAAGAGPVMGAGRKIAGALGQLGPLSRMAAGAVPGATLGATAVSGQQAGDEALPVGKLSQDRVRQIQSTLGLKVDGVQGPDFDRAVGDYNSRLKAANAQQAEQRRVADEERQRANKLADEERQRKQAADDARSAEMAGRRQQRTKAEEERAAERRKDPLMTGLAEWAPYVAGAVGGGLLRGGQRATQAREGVKNAEALAGYGQTSREARDRFYSAGSGKKGDAVREAAQGEMRGSANALYSSRNQPSPFAADAPGGKVGKAEDLYKAPGKLKDDGIAYGALAGGAGISYGLAENYKSKADEAMQQYEQTGDKRFLERAMEYEQTSKFYRTTQQAETGALLAYSAGGATPRPSPFPRSKTNPTQPGKDFADVMAGRDIVRGEMEKNARKGLRTEYNADRALYRADVKKGLQAEPPKPWTEYKREGMRDAGFGKQAGGSGSVATDVAKVGGAAVAGGGASVAGVEGMKAYTERDDKTLGHLRESQAARRAGFREIMAKDPSVVEGAIDRVMSDPAHTVKSGERAGKLRGTSVRAVVEEIEKQTGSWVSPYEVRKMMRERGANFD